MQRFREVKNRCYTSRITEKEAVDLAVLGLAKPIKDLAFQLEFSSLAHMVQKLTAYEHYNLIYTRKSSSAMSIWPKLVIPMTLARNRKWL